MDWQTANHIWQVNDEPMVIQAVDAVTGLAALAASSVQYRIKDCDFLWCMSVAVSTGSFKTRVRINADSQPLDNDYVRSENFWGSNFSAPMRHCPKFIPVGGLVSIDMIDTSNATNAIYLYLIGFRARTHFNKWGEHKGDPMQRLRAPDGRCCMCHGCRWGMGRGLFVYHTPNNAVGTGSITYGTAGYGIQLPANSVATFDCVIEDRYHFRCHDINAKDSSAGTAASTWKSNIDVKDPRDRARRKVAGGQMLAQAFTGSAGDQGMLPSPIVGENSTSILFDMADAGYGTNNPVHIALIGERCDDDILEMNA